MQIRLIIRINSFILNEGLDLSTLLFKFQKGICILALTVDGTIFLYLYCIYFRPMHFIQDFDVT